ncbi:ABC transporter substrate-binding protein [Dehalococcoidia bacterium]|nr:ABC transporter substrate-binding protein [Dehalococcoidia bacterium]
MSKRKMIGLLMCILLLGSVLAAGCPAPQAEVAVEVPQEVVAGLGRDPVGARGAHPYLTRIVERLVFSDFEMNPQPGLAKSWEVSENGMTWTLYLREGVKFHDGTAFNAEAVRFNLERLIEKTPMRFGSIESIAIIDDYTIKVRHNKIFAPFIRTLTGVSIFTSDSFDAEGRVIKSIGTGPFKQVEWIDDDRLVMDRNEDYWGGMPKLERITLKFIPEPTTRMMALETGEIDMIIDTGGILPEHVATLEANPDIEVITSPIVTPHYLTFNNNKTPFDDVRVRRAVMYAIDRGSIIQYAMEGYGIPSKSVMPHVFVDWVHPHLPYEFNNPAKARELLQAAGWVDTDGDDVLDRDGQEFRVTFLLAAGLVGRWPYATIAEIVQAQLREVGIIVDIQTVDTGLWRDMQRKGEAHMTIRPFAGRDISHRTRLHEWFHSEGRVNNPHGQFYYNPRVDELTEKLLRTVNEKEARTISFEIQEIVAEEVPMLPIYDEIMINAVRTNIRGYKPHPRFIVNWEDIYVVAP